MNPEVTVPLPIGPAAADFEKGQLLAAGRIINQRVRAVIRGPGSAAIGVKDA